MDWNRQKWVDKSRNSAVQLHEERKSFLILIQIYWSFSKETLWFFSLQNYI